MVAFGLPLFGVVSLRGDERTAELPMRQIIAATAWCGASLSVVALVSLAASMAGIALSAIDHGTIITLLCGTAIGKAWIIRMATLGVIALLCLRRWRNPAVVLAAVSFAGGVALATFAWTGHAVMGDGWVGWLHLMADVVHLLAAGVWVGALLGLLLLVTTPLGRVDAVRVTLAHRALVGFAGTGTAVVGAIFLTGAINAWFLVGPTGLRALTTTLYGELLLAKVVLFGVMVGLATANRFRLVPLLGQAIPTDDTVASVEALRRSLTLETFSAVAVLAIVALLGTLEPIATAM